MVYQLVVKSSARKELAKLPSSERLRVISAFISIQTDPFQGKELSGQLKGFRSLRVWPYRIIYEIYRHELIIRVITIAHRKDAYRR